MPTAYQSPDNPNDRPSDAESKTQPATPKSNSYVAAVLSVAGAVFINAAANWWNGRLEDRRAEQTLILEDKKAEQARILEDKKAEQARVFEMIKTGNIAQAAKNLKFLVKVGLITNSGVRDKIDQYVANAPAGTGPALPPSGFTSPTVSSYNYTSPTTSNYNYTTPKKGEGVAPAKSNLP